MEKIILMIGLGVTLFMMYRYLKKINQEFHTLRDYTQETQAENTQLRGRMNELNQKVSQVQMMLQNEINQTIESSPHLLNIIQDANQMMIQKDLDEDDEDIPEISHQQFEKEYEQKFNEISNKTMNSLNEVNDDSSSDEDDNESETTDDTEESSEEDVDEELPEIQENKELSEDNDDNKSQSSIKTVEHNDMNIQEMVESIVDEHIESSENQEEARQNEIHNDNDDVLSVAESNFSESSEKRKKVPGQPAKNYDVGYEMTSENDGQLYIVEVMKNGVKRWKLKK
jgi:hypothetical protein